VPPNTCGWGYKNRTRKVKINLNEESHILLFFCRDKIQDAKHNGEKCAKLRIIEISEIINCNVPCELPVDCQVGEWGLWTSCSATCNGGTKERTREKIADAENNGANCVSARKTIPLTESNTCNNVGCATMNHGVTLEGSSSSHDRGQVYLNGRPLCDDGIEQGAMWDINDAKVICRMLGFSTATKEYSDKCPFGNCPPGLSFVMSGFNCTGTEAHIIDCPHDGAVSDKCGSSGVTDGVGGVDYVGVECA